MHREKIVETLPEMSKGFSFMSQKDYEDLPTVPYIDKHGKFIPNHPKLPPVLYILKRPKEDSTSEHSLSSIPWYPQLQWETTPISTEDDRPICILSITTKVPPARLDTTKRDLRCGDCQRSVKNKLMSSGYLELSFTSISRQCVD